MLIDKAIHYVEMSFGVECTILDWHEVSNLPFYLRQAFTYRVFEVLKQRFLLVSIPEKDLDFVTIQKHRLKLSNYLSANEPIIFIFDQVSNYLRKQLMNDRISFIVPGKQIFIFELGSVFSEKRQSGYSGSIEIPKDKWMPATQALFLYLMRTEDFSSSMELIAKRLNLTKMSVSRGFLELTRLGIILRENKLGNERYQFNSSKKNSWEKAKVYSINPVSKTYSIHKDCVDERTQTLLITSGETALAHHTLMSKPSNIVYGISNKQFKETFGSINQIPMRDKDAITIQVYKHTMQAKDGVLDPLSVALIFKDEQDERIQSEISSMLVRYFKQEEENEKKQIDWHG